MRIRYSLARRRAREFLSHAGITGPPIPVSKLATLANARVHYAPMAGDLDGMVHLRDGAAVIGVNALHSRTRQRFTIAHELGHLLLHATEGDLHIDERNPIGLRNSLSGEAKEPREIEANQFAAELLMPERFVMASVDKVPDGIDVDAAIEELAREYEVSPQAMSYRLANLRVVRWE